VEENPSNALFLSNYAQFLYQVRNLLPTSFYSTIHSITSKKDHLVGMMDCNFYFYF